MKCTDKNCKKHGSIATRGRVFVGRVISAKMAKTATIEWDRRKYIPKFERYEKRRSRIKAHSPDCMQIVDGDTVQIQECRPLSKTKKFVVINKI